MGERFYVRLVIFGLVAAGLAIFWPVIELFAKGKWAVGLLVAATGIAWLTWVFVQENKRR